LSPTAREREDNLLFVRDRLLRSEGDPAALLHLYEQVWNGRPVPDDEANPLVTMLRLSGVVRVENRRLRVRHRIYAHVFDRDWVRANRPQAEVRRQKAAFQRGAMRAAAVAGVIVLGLGALVGFAVREAAIARRATRSVRRAAEETRRYAAKLDAALRET